MPNVMTIYNDEHKLALTPNKTMMRKPNRKTDWNQTERLTGKTKELKYIKFPQTRSPNYAQVLEEITSS